MIKKISGYLKELEKISLDGLSIDYLYSELICHENKRTDISCKDALRIFADISDMNRKEVKILDDSIQFTNIDNVNNNVMKVELGVFCRLDYSNIIIDNLLNFLHKKKIKYNGRFNIYDNVGYLIIELIDIDVVLNVIDYINSKLKEYIYSVNPLFFAVDDVMVSVTDNYSYIEILSMYLYDYINDIKINEKEIDYVSFKEFLLNKYFELKNQIDMYKFVKYNTKNIKLSCFFANLDTITNLIIYMFNGSDYDEFKGYYKKINRKNSKRITEYNIYDNMDGCKLLLEELVKVMYINYGEAYTRDNIINYRDTGKLDCITRKDNLRKKIISSKNFMIYLRSISLGYELDRIIDMVSLDIKIKILEEVYANTYRVCWASGNQKYGKVQVARGLIRMEYGDYSMITRDNESRKKAMENISPDEVIFLIRKTLGLDDDVKKEKLYEIYANYIENICIS